MYSQTHLTAFKEPTWELYAKKLKESNEYKDVEGIPVYEQYHKQVLNGKIPTGMPFLSLVEPNITPQKTTMEAIKYAKKHMQGDNHTYNKLYQGFKAGADYIKHNS